MVVLVVEVGVVEWLDEWLGGVVEEFASSVYLILIPETLVS